MFEEGVVVPYLLRKDKEGWQATCRLCDDFESGHYYSALTAASEVTRHAKFQGGGDHYDAVSGLYYPPERLAQVREQTRRRRSILGSENDTVNINRAGL